MSYFKDKLADIIIIYNEIDRYFQDSIAYVKKI